MSRPTGSSGTPSANGPPLPKAGAVADMLARHTEALCQHLLSAGRRHGNYWQVGDVTNAPGSSMWVHLWGPKAGHWQDAGTGEFGDALDLVAACLHHGDKKEAYAWALDYLGITCGNRARQAPRPANDARPTRPQQSDEQRRKAAVAMWLAAEPTILHTPVDAYLRGRGIDLSTLGRQPRALRFHPRLYHRESRMYWPAMVAAISGADGTQLATHRTWLERVGGAWVKARIEPNKMSYGNFAGGAIHLWRGASGRPFRQARADEPVCIGEGIETCLSVVLACPEFRVVSGVSLGNLGSVWLPEQVRMVVLLAENDDKAAPRQAFQRVAERYLQRGIEVRFARPNRGKDFNDELRGVA
ncbi:MAG: toprim domain-containing protein [Acetobacteraceae bacterium]